MKVGDSFLESLGQEGRGNGAERAIGNEVEEVVGGFEGKFEKGKDGGIEADTFEIHPERVVFDCHRIKKERRANRLAFVRADDGQGGVE